MVRTGLLAYHSFRFVKLCLLSSAPWGGDFHGHHLDACTMTVQLSAAQLLSTVRLTPAGGGAGNNPQAPANGAMAELFGFQGQQQARVLSAPSAQGQVSAEGLRQQFINCLCR